jgi:hypothetical protein
MRNRTSGGVGGRRGNPAPYPIFRWLRKTSQGLTIRFCLTRHTSRAMRKESRMR